MAVAAAPGGALIVGSPKASTHFLVVQDGDLVDRRCKEMFRKKIDPIWDL